MRDIKLFNIKTGRKNKKMRYTLHDTDWGLLFYDCDTKGHEMRVLRDKNDVFIDSISKFMLGEITRFLGKNGIDVDFPITFTTPEGEFSVTFVYYRNMDIFKSIKKYSEVLEVYMSTLVTNI